MSGLPLPCLLRYYCLHPRVYLQESLHFFSVFFHKFKIGNVIYINTRDAIVSIPFEELSFSSQISWRTLSETRLSEIQVM